MANRRDTLAGLRQSLARIEAGGTAALEPAPRFTFGMEGLDESIGGGLPRAALHEIFAAGVSDGAAAGGVGLGMMLRACGASRKIVWIRQDLVAREIGELHAPGLVEWGADPANIVLVRARDAPAALRAGHEALRCQALGAVIIEPWGNPPVLDLTASRRLAGRAARSGVSAIMLRLAAEPMPSAALSRWQVRARPSQPLAADAPGHPAFELCLLRHKAGFPPRSFIVEWDRDASCFREPALSRRVVAFPADRPAAEAAWQWRRTG